MQRWFNIANHSKNLMIISEKAFDRTHHLFIVKTLNKGGLEDITKGPRKWSAAGPGHDRRMWHLQSRGCTFIDVGGPRNKPRDVCSPGNRFEEPPPRRDSAGKCQDKCLKVNGQFDRIEAKAREEGAKEPGCFVKYGWVGNWFKNEFWTSGVSKNGMSPFSPISPTDYG